MNLLKTLPSGQAGFIPVSLLWVIALAFVIGGLTGVTAYWLTHAGVSFLAFIAVLLIVFCFVVPILPRIIKWSQSALSECKEKEKGTPDEKEES